MLQATVVESRRIKEVVQYFLHLGLLGFGGPVAQA
jgi:chromate transport protein ChrA